MLLNLRQMPIGMETYHSNHLPLSMFQILTLTRYLPYTSTMFRHLFVSDISSAKQDMLAAIADISQWSFTHKLKLNPDKSEVIWLGSRQQLAKPSEADKSLQLPDGLVRSSTTVKNLGVMIDERLSFDDQARSCIKSCYFHLRRLKQIRRYVEPDVIHSLVHVFVTSHLDYCNGLLAGCKPRAGCGVVRIDPLRFLAGCRTRRLNQVSSVCHIAFLLLCCCLL